ncbi:hypothetical protein [Streptomyces glaucosporus]
MVSTETFDAKVACGFPARLRPATPHRLRALLPYRQGTGYGRRALRDLRAEPPALAAVDTATLGLPAPSGTRMGDNTPWQGTASWPTV